MITQHLSGIYGDITAMVLDFAFPIIAEAGEIAVRRPLGFFDVWLLPRVWLGAAFCLIGLVLLARFRVSQVLRLVFLAVAFFAFGVVLILPLGDFARGMSVHPSPICVVTKPFLFITAGRDVPLVFLSILAFVAAFSVVGNKLFCGWVCPIGAIQEGLHRIPLPRKFKIKLPFWVTNALRIALYLVFLVIVFTAGVSIYDYFNPFEFLFWGFQIAIVMVFAATLLAGVFLFRAFCYLICPIGLVTWVLEHLSVFKVRVNKERCTACNVCVEASPCPSVPAILESKKSRPDCFACGRCIEVCPEKALGFRV